MNGFEIEHLTLGGSRMVTQQDVNALKDLEDPSQGRTWSGVSHLVGEGLLPCSQLGTQLMFSQRIDQQTQSHDHQQGHDPLGLFQKQAGREEQGIFQEAKATFYGHPLAFVGREERCCGKLLLLQSSAIAMTQMAQGKVSKGSFAC